MHTCKICNKEFEAWEYEWECNNCDDNGLEERWYDWCFNEPEIRPCSTCNGEKEVMCSEIQFCSEDCREQYFYNNEN